MPVHPRKSPPISLTIIGLGSVGQVLASAFKLAGLCELTLVGRGRPGEKSLAKALKAQYLSDVRQIRQNHGYIIICVKDNQITQVSRVLSRLPLEWTRLTGLHTSGTLGTNVLKPLISRGAAVAAWHPYQTFPKIPARRATCQHPPGCWSPTLPETKMGLFSGVTFGISGDSRAVRAAGRLTRILGGKPLRIREEDRVLYHLSAVLSCGFVAADLEMAVRVLKKIGLSDKRALEAIMPIALQTLENVAELGPRHALTGPAVRGDEATIKKHLRALKKSDPELAKLYAAVSHYCLFKYR